MLFNSPTRHFFDSIFGKRPRFIDLQLAYHGLTRGGKRRRKRSIQAESIHHEGLILLHVIRRFFCEQIKILFADEIYNL
jgi:hypothetical protein